MKKWSLLAFIFFYSILVSNSQNIILEKDVISSGGSNMKNESFTLNGSIGQPIIGISQNSAVSDYQGFWYVITDFEGESTNTQDLLKGLSSLTIIPNPTSYEGLIVFYAMEKMNLQIEIINSLGQKTNYHFSGEVYEGKNQLPFDSSLFAPGQYFVNITSNDRTYSKKIVIIK